jgi:hypothetical protein
LSPVRTRALNFRQFLVELCECFDAYPTCDSLGRLGLALLRDPESLTVTINPSDLVDDWIFDGVQLDTQGRVLGYWLDGQSLLKSNVLVHLFDLERYTNYRGISPIRRGANNIDVISYLAGCFVAGMGLPPGRTGNPRLKRLYFGKRSNAWRTVSIRRAIASEAGWARSSSRQVS